jgi:hypothetical protein
MGANRSWVRRGLAVLGLFASGTVPAWATYGSATPQRALIAAQIVTAITTETTTLERSLVEIDHNIVSAGSNITNALKALMKTNVQTAKQETTALASAMRQSRSAANIMRLYQMQSGLQPPPAACLQTEAAQQSLVGAAQVNAASASTSVALSSWNQGVPIDAAAAKSARITRTTTIATSAAYNQALNQQTKGVAFQSAALFHPAPPASSSTTGPSSSSTQSPLTPAQLAAIYAGEITNPSPIGTPPASLTQGSGSATWQAALLAAQARMSLAQGTLRQTVRWRTASPALQAWAQTIAKDSSPSGVYLKGKIQSAKNEGVSSDVMLKWLAQARFQNPLWYNAESGATQTGLLRSLTFMLAQSLMMQDRQLRISERIESMEAARLAMAERHRERSVLASLRVGGAR